MKISVRKAKNDFPGSTFRRVDADMDDGRSIPLFGISKETKRGISYWEHDSRPITFQTIAEVKEYANNNISDYLYL